MEVLGLKATRLMIRKGKLYSWPDMEEGRIFLRFYEALLLHYFLHVCDFKGTRVFNIVHCEGHNSDVWEFFCLLQTFLINTSGEKC